MQRREEGGAAAVAAGEKGAAVGYERATAGDFRDGRDGGGQEQIAFSPDAPSKSAL